MHAWHKKYETTCHAQKCLMNHALSPKCAQQFEDNERKKTHFWPNSIFYFSKFFQEKLLFFFIFNMTFFFISSFLFQTCKFFFCQFSFNTQKIFFQRKRIWHSFFDFSSFHFFYSKVKHYPITRKEQNEKLFFCIFSRIQNTFFWFWQESNLRILLTSCNLLTQKEKLLFSFFFLQKNHDTCTCFIINLQKKY